LYLAEKAAAGTVIDLPQIPVDLRQGEQRQPAHLARNPFGKLPVLELDDGSHLVESLAIIEYLEECYPDPPMTGRSPLERARARELERIADLTVPWPRHCSSRGSVACKSTRAIRICCGGMPPIGGAPPRRRY
jgi:glutathione S-transferase